MDRRERQRLKNEIDRGAPNVGIRKVEEGAYEKENRSPLVKGGGVGLGIGGAAGVAYAQSVGVFHRSPLGLFPDDYVLVMLGIIAGGTLMGAAGGWLFNKVVPKRGKSPKA
jgi:hypothetical protein